jgi:hypothetical protein
VGVCASLGLGVSTGAGRGGVVVGGLGAWGEDTGWGGNSGGAGVTGCGRGREWEICEMGLRIDEVATACLEGPPQRFRAKTPSCSLCGYEPILPEHVLPSHVDHYEQRQVERPD